MEGVLLFGEDVEEVGGEEGVEVGGVVEESGKEEEESLF